MKLPPELKRRFKTTPMTHEKRQEAIVRDCAQVCFDAALGARKKGFPILAEFFQADGLAILARYGLEKKNG